MTVVPSKTEIVDLFWRSIWTFIASFIGLISANGLDIVILDYVQMAKIAGLTVLTTVIKTYVSNKNGTGTATELQRPILGTQPVASNSATPVGQ